MLYCLKLVVIAVVTLPAAIATIAIGLFDPYGNYVYEISRCWAWQVLRVGGISVKTDGLDNLDPKGQYIFMVNHQSNIDIPVLVQSLPAFQLRWIAKKELLWVPLFGWAMWAAKHIPVDRADRLGALGRLKKAKERMKAGISVVFFPEGTRSTDGQLLPFKRGGFLLALQTQTAIVPVTINGSGAILPKGDWRIRCGQVEVSVGEPISVQDHRPGSLRGLSAKVQALIGEKLRTACDFTNPAASAAQPMRAARSPTEEPTA